MDNKPAPFKNIFTGVGRTDDERSMSPFKKDSLEMLRCILSSGSGRYTYTYSISRARTLISSYHELILTERKMIATAQRKHDNRVHLK